MIIPSPSRAVESRDGWPVKILSAAFAAAGTVFVFSKGFHAGTLLLFFLPLPVLPASVRAVSALAWSGFPGERGGVPEQFQLFGGPLDGACGRMTRSKASAPVGFEGLFVLRRTGVAFYRKTGARDARGRAVWSHAAPERGPEHVDA